MAKRSLRTRLREVERKMAKAATRGKKNQFDTSFNFGANVKKGPKARQSRSTRQAYAVAYRQGQHPRQTRGGGS